MREPMQLLHRFIVMIFYSSNVLCSWLLPRCGFAWIHSLHYATQPYVRNTTRRRRYDILVFPLAFFLYAIKRMAYKQVARCRRTSRYLSLQVSDRITPLACSEDDMLSGLCYVFLASMICPGFVRGCSEGDGEIPIYSTLHIAPDVCMYGTLTSVLFPAGQSLTVAAHSR